MTIEDMPIGTKIDIEVRFSGRNFTFNSEMVLLLDKNSILINPIVVNDKTLGFNDFITNLVAIVNNKAFLWENVKINLVRYEGAIYHKVTLEGEGKSYNRREAFRLYIGENMTIYYNTASGPTQISVLVKDISESGVGFITKEELDVNRMICLKIKDQNVILDLTAVIIRKEHLPHLNSFLYGCKFNEKNNRLGKYIARRQVEILRSKLRTISSNSKK